ncbi:nitric oxide-associated protein 1 [Amblyomma americanum]
MRLCANCHISRYLLVSRAALSIRLRSLSSPCKRSFSSDADDVPISYMGLGFNKVRLARQKLRRELRKEERGNTLPAYFAQLVKSDAEQLEKLYPQLANIVKKELTDAAPETRGEPEKKYQFPFQQFTASSCKPCATHELTVNQSSHERNESVSKYLDSLQSAMQKLDISEDLAGIRSDVWRANYGSADATVPPSQVPCGGCGAFLHCSDTAIPGFLPAEVFAGLNDDQLRQRLCQRCIFLQHYNTALNVKVDQDAYKSVLAEVSRRKALVLLLLDLTDMPCSIWPDLPELLGPQQPVLAVANKVDLVPCDAPGYLSRIKECVTKTLKGAGLSHNLRGVCLISAKTGYGVEDLITCLHDTWRMKGDIYLVGCTNVGKSTLFNTLLQSDLCQEQATDLVHRATTSVWPGTTLNLLKFPVLRPRGWELHLRSRRLARDNWALHNEVHHRRKLYSSTLRPEYATLIGRIGMTFKKGGLEADLGVRDRPFKLDEPKLKGTHFCYDTPGAVYKDQILDLLTLEELLLLLPRKMITPRTISLRCNQSLLLTGLARLDLLDVPRSQSVLVTVFASELLPIHVLDTPDVDRFRAAHLGTEMLGVPCGTAERLAQLPPLESRDFTLEGQGLERSCADLVFSSVGWLSLTFCLGERVSVRTWSPSGRGLHCRVPALLPAAVQLRGPRIRGTPAFANRQCSALLA